MAGGAVKKQYLVLIRKCIECQQVFGCTVNGVQMICDTCTRDCKKTPIKDHVGITGGVCDLCLAYLMKRR